MVLREIVSLERLRKKLSKVCSEISRFMEAQVRWIWRTCKSTCPCIIRTVHSVVILNQTATQPTHIETWECTRGSLWDWEWTVVPLWEQCPVCALRNITYLTCQMWLQIVFFAMSESHIYSKFQSNTLKIQVYGKMQTSKKDVEQNIEVLVYNTFLSSSLFPFPWVMENSLVFYLFYFYISFKLYLWIARVILKSMASYYIICPSSTDDYVDLSSQFFGYNKQS